MQIFPPGETEPSPPAPGGILSEISTRIRPSPLIISVEFSARLYSRFLRLSLFTPISFVVPPVTLKPTPSGSILLITSAMRLVSSITSLSEGSSSPDRMALRSEQSALSFSADSRISLYPSSPPLLSSSRDAEPIMPDRWLFMSCMIDSAIRASVPDPASRASPWAFIPARPETASPCDGRVKQKSLILTSPSLTHGNTSMVTPVVSPVMDLNLTRPVSYSAGAGSFLRRTDSGRDVTEPRGKPSPLLSISRSSLHLSLAHSTLFPGETAIRPTALENWKRSAADCHGGAPGELRTVPVSFLLLLSDSIISAPGTMVVTTITIMMIISACSALSRFFIIALSSSITV